MLGYLGGNASTVEAYHASIGKTIAKAVLDADAEDDGAVIIDFTDGSGLSIFDAGRSCCESRYITCDDDLAGLAGAKLMDIELRDGGSVEADYDCHETQFVEIVTSNGNATLCTHNEHNGYYGGFCIRLASRNASRGVVA